MCVYLKQGRPELLDPPIGNMFFFEWRTVVKCTGTIKDPEPQMPCYVYNSTNTLYDLTPLTKLNGGYTVKSSKTDDTVIVNVCRNVTDGMKPSWL